MTPDNIRQAQHRDRLKEAGIIQCNVKVRTTDREWFKARASESRAGTLPTTTAPTATTSEDTSENTSGSVQTTTAPTAPRACPGQRIISVAIPDRDDCQGEVERLARILCQDKPVRVTR